MGPPWHHSLSRTLTLRKSVRAVAALPGVTVSHLSRAAGCPSLLPQGACGQFG